MAAITSFKEEMFVKMDTVVTEVDLFQADFRNMLERVSVAEGHVNKLQQEVEPLKKTVVDLRAATTRMEDHIEDVKGLSRRNNLHFRGFPERAERQSVEMFLEE
ncbi:hypothetical protein NDU88_000970 [Pleurodeles waltl]|uniref:Uncharacterized protein n=1 Tax=Pleurodeles waltl TaxID=8319 RepID=A0AAV7MNJ7_PLEWA|nr:hypothetical protein NDU88_000970 [Pleurodeles waltl]